MPTLFGDLLIPLRVVFCLPQKWHWLTLICWPYTLLVVCCNCEFCFAHVMQKLTTGCLTAWGSKAYNWMYHCLRLKSLRLDVSLPEAQKLTTGCITAWGSKAYDWMYHCLRLRSLWLYVSLPEAQKLTTGSITAWGSKAYDWMYHCLRLRSLRLDLSLPESQKLTTGCITAWGSKAYDWMYHYLRLKSLRLDVSLPEAHIEILLQFCVPLRALVLAALHAGGCQDHHILMGHHILYI